MKTLVLFAAIGGFGDTEKPAEYPATVHTFADGHTLTITPGPIMPKSDYVAPAGPSWGERQDYLVRESQRNNPIRFTRPIRATRIPSYGSGIFIAPIGVSGGK